MKTTILFFFVIFFSLFPKNVFANQEYINLIHPVRISNYNKTPFESIKAEYKEIIKRRLPSTWLVTYDVLEDSKIIEFIKDFDKKQEIGIFVEVTPDLAKRAGVDYHSSDSWHRARSLFLVGYKQKERIKLINILFAQFKGRFGFYPKSVGAWWIDSFSLEYMFKKYGIITNLSVADQYSTDNYSIWGQYWSYPFYPSKFHAGIPATEKNKLGVVTIQWAPRDPLNAYGDSIVSKYSSQDYLTLGFNNDYLKNLFKLYALKNSNLFGQAVFGLEADLPEDVYSKSYSTQLDTLVGLANKTGMEFLTMEEFGKWFKAKFKETPSSLIGGSDLLNTKVRSYWYQTPEYRMGIIFNPETKSIELVDFRIYQENFQEPFYKDKVTEDNLLINIPSVVDKINDPSSVVKFDNINSFNLSYSGAGVIITLSDNKKIILKKESIVFENFSQKDLSKLLNHPYIKVKIGDDITIQINKNFPVDKEGVKLRNLSVATIYFLIRPKIKLITPIIIIASVLLFLFTIYLISKKHLSIFYLLILTVAVISGAYVTYLVLNKLSHKYIISQSEYDALLHLKVKKKGVTVVEDSKCLVCATFDSTNPSYGNIRDYVGVLSGKKLLYNNKLFGITDHKKAGEYLYKLGAKYIILSKNQGFENRLKLSPGDYKIVKIYENSISQIWEVIN